MTSGRCVDRGYVCRYSRMAKKRGRILSSRGVDDGTLTLPRVVGRSSDQHAASEETTRDTPAAQGAYRQNGNNGNRSSIASSLSERLEPTISPFCGSSSSSLHAAALTNTQIPCNSSLSSCRYSCLEPLLPYLQHIIAPSVACDLLDVYFTEPGSSIFSCASSYVLTQIIRKKSLLHPSHPRSTTPALLCTMLWCASHTADVGVLHIPGSRMKVTNSLYETATAMVA